MVNYRTQLFASVTSIVVAGFFLPQIAPAQTPNDFMRPPFGGTLRQAMRPAAPAEWQRIPPDVLACIDQSLRRQGANIGDLIDAGVVLSDPRLARLRSACSSATSTVDLDNFSSRPVADCAKAPGLTARVVCLDRSGGAAGWDLNSAYWAAYFSLPPTERQQFDEAQDRWLDSVNASCGTRPQNQQGQCVSSAYRARATTFRSRLGPDALSESLLSPEQHARIQQSLISLGFFADALDGEFGANTRAAIKRFQNQLGLPETEFLTPRQLQQLLEDAASTARPDQARRQNEAQPGFDCATARTPDEVTICSSLELSVLDNAVGAGYDYVRRSSGEQFAKHIDLPLLQARQACGADAACIKTTQLEAIRAFNENGAPVGVSNWTLSGSTMLLITIGRSRLFFYETPRAAVTNVGAAPGSLSFQGEAINNQYAGTAYIFNSRCGQIPFQVRGPILDSNERVVLEGFAPRIGPNCVAQGYVRDAMEFRLLEQSPIEPSSRVAQQSPTQNVAPDQAAQKPIEPSSRVAQQPPAQNIAPDQAAQKPIEPLSRVAQQSPTQNVALDEAAQKPIEPLSRIAQQPPTQNIAPDETAQKPIESSSRVAQQPPTQNITPDEAAQSTSAAQPEASAASAPAPASSLTHANEPPTAVRASPEPADFAPLSKSLAQIPQTRDQTEADEIPTSYPSQISEPAVTLILLGGVWAFAAAMIVLVYLASTKKIVLFWDTTDAGLCAAPYIVLLGGLLLGHSFGLGGLVGELTIYAAIWAAAWLMIVSTVSSYRQNYFLPGYVRWLVPPLRLVFSVTAIFIFVLQFVRLLDRRGSFSGKVAAFAIVGGLLWLVRKLVNGSAVFEARGLREPNLNGINRFIWPFPSPEVDSEESQRSAYERTSSSSDSFESSGGYQHEWSPEPVRTWWEVLGVPPTAVLDEVKAAYREQLKRYHPDRVVGLGIKLRQLAEEECKALNAAYEDARNELDPRRAAAASA